MNKNNKKISEEKEDKIVKKSNKTFMILILVLSLGILLIFISMFVHMGSNNFSSCNENNFGSGHSFMDHNMDHNRDSNMDSNSHNIGMDHNMDSNLHSNLNSKTPTEPGQDAFGTIGEIVNILNNDPNTNWKTVNITALKEHLIDMDLLITKTNVFETKISNGIEIKVIANDNRSVEAIKRMVPAHSEMILNNIWNSKVQLIGNGVIFQVSDKNDFEKIRALGFYGLMAYGGNHHQIHHMELARGKVLFN